MMRRKRIKSKTTSHSTLELGFNLASVAGFSPLKLSFDKESFEIAGDQKEPRKQDFLRTI